MTIRFYCYNDILHCTKY